jgi:CBS domain-containing protein
MRIDDPVARIMSVPVYSVRSSQPVSDVRRLIQEHGFHHVPVVDDGVLVGMLSSSSGPGGAERG